MVNGSISYVQEVHQPSFEVEAKEEGFTMSRQLVAAQLHAAQQRDLGAMVITGSGGRLWARSVACDVCCQEMKESGKMIAKLH